MQIKTVEYRQLKSFGNYNNEVVGAVAEVGEKESAEEVVGALKKWVQARLGAREEVANVESELSALQYEKNQLEADIRRQKKVYEQLVKLLKKHGVKVADQVPF